MRAISARSATLALDVEVRWGDGELLVSEHLRGLARYVLCTGLLPAQQAGFVVLPEWLERDGGSDGQALVTIQDDGAVVHHTSGASQTLRLGEQTLSQVGPLSFRIAVTEPRANAAHASWRALWKPREQAWTFASLALHALVLGCMLLLPPKASSLSLDLMSEDTRYARYLNTPVAPEQLPWTPNDDTKNAQTNEEQGARHAGDEGAAGKQDTPRLDRRMAVKGKASERVLAKTTAEQARTAGLLGALATASLQLGPSSPFGADTPLGYDPVDALGKLFGDTIGDSAGFNGLGMRGTGRRGGGDARDTIGVGELGTRDGARNTPGAHGVFGLTRSAQVPMLRSGPVEVRGSLSKETIRRHIHMHMNELRFCYEQGLTDNPELAGRVSVSFLIAPSGAVQQAAVSESTLPSREVGECVTRALRRFSFPAPDGGGYVQVTYPFSFASGQ